MTLTLANITIVKNAILEPGYWDSDLSFTTYQPSHFVQTFMP